MKPIFSLASTIAALARLLGPSNARVGALCAVLFALGLTACDDRKPASQAGAPPVTVAP
jgi:hypothetical protein